MRNYLKNSSPQGRRAHREYKGFLSALCASAVANRFVCLVVAVLLSALFLQEVLSMRLMSASNDENTHLPSGYTYLKTGQIRLNQQHPPLIKLLCALPLLFLNPKLNLEDPAWKSEPPNEWIFGFKFLYSNDADKLLFWGRMPVVMLSLVLGLYVFRWARELFGVRAGVAALLLYAFCPNIIAHSRFVTMDLGLSCFSTICLYYLWRFIKRGGRAPLILSGIALGLALATKFSAVTLMPILAINLYLACFFAAGSTSSPNPLTKGKRVKASLVNFLQVRDLERGSKLKFALVALMCILAIASVIVYATYLFPSDLGFYLNGIKLVNKDHRPDYMYYLLGDFKAGGWWYYFLVAFALKTPLSVLLALALAFFWLRSRAEKFFDDLFLLVPVISFFIFTSALADNLGLRYILPIYPLLFVFVSRLGEILTRQRIGLVLALAIAAWHVYSALAIYPDYLAYFNELAGGPQNGHKYLDDSNIDWGQDLKRLKGYMEQNNIRSIKLVYLFYCNPSYYGIKAERIRSDLTAVSPEPGIYAVSAHALVRWKLLKKLYGLNSDWMERFKPAGRVGYSLYIFKIGPEQAAGAAGK